MKLKALILLGFLTLSPFVVFSQIADLLPGISEIVDKNYQTYYELYTHLHQNPELSFQEKESSKRMADELRKAGFEVIENVGGYGVVGVLKNGEGPTVLIRTDLDALPIEEKTGLSYASKVKTIGQNGRETSVMHACGHDIHMTVFVATANILSGLKDKWSGTLVMIGQPAEERISGAKIMLEDGLFERFPKPDHCLALHVSPSMEVGTVGIKSGPAAASDDHIDITVFGIGGHGAYPNKCIDPIVLSSRIVMALQTITSRENNPLEPLVVTVGAIHGGTKHNIIPAEVKMLVTLRAYSEEARQDAIKGIKQIVKGIAISAGLPEDKYPLVKLGTESTPSLINDEKLTEQTRLIFIKVFGEENVITGSLGMGSEDFSELGSTKDDIPIMLFGIGTVSSKKYKAHIEEGAYLPGLHTSTYAPVPELSIKTGAKAMSSAALGVFLNSNK